MGWNRMEVGCLVLLELSGHRVVGLNLCSATCEFGSVSYDKNEAN